MEKTIVTIETARNAYSPKQIISSYRTLTVGELISLLQDYDEDTPVIISNDHGYTYGAIREDNINETSIEED